MSWINVVSTFHRVLAHHVTVRHALSKAPIPSLDPKLVDAPPDWVVSVVGNDVVVSAPEGADGSLLTPIPSVEVGVTDPAVALYLDLDHSVDPPTINIPLIAAELEETVDSVPLTIEVELLDDQGNPVESEVITIRSNSGASRTTTEVEPGVYRTDPDVFPQSFHQFNVVLDGDVIGSGQIETYTLTTAIKLIDPT